MKKIRLLTVASSLVLGLGLMAAAVSAEENDYIAISDYTETFKPGNGTDASLTIDVTGNAGEDGYLYVVKNADMTFVDMTGENIDAALEEYVEGSISYYRVKVLDTAQQASVSASFTVPSFYAGEKKSQDSTGLPNYSVSYTFTNPFHSTIGKYTVYIYAPEGMEIVKVTEPSKYAKQKLGEEEGLRYVGAGGELAASAACGVAFSYNKPLSAIAKIAIWAAAIAVGGFVFIDRYKKVKQ